MRALAAALLTALCILACPAFAGQAREQGRTQNQEQPPDSAQDKSGLPRVYGATFSSTFTIYAISPDLLAGWNGPLRGYEKKWIPARYQKLPVLGGWYGHGFFPDREVLLSANLDKALLLTSDTGFTTDIEKSLIELGLPYKAIRSLHLDDYAPMFRELGAEFAMPERGEALAAHIGNLLDRTRRMIRDIPEGEKLRVFLAQGPDGLGTVCAESGRSELLTAAGGKNVHQCSGALSPDASIRVSFEQVMAYDPDAVIIMHPSFIERFKEDKKWRHLRAVREGRVYMAPHEPFAWMDKPSTFMRVIAMPWLACTLYPERCAMDVAQETRDFMNLFFHLDLNEEAVRFMLNP